MLRMIRTAASEPPSRSDRYTNNDAHRRRMLWEIAVDNQAIEPKVSISSIVEINKMNGTYQTAAKDTAINITINNNLLPKGKLDT